VIAKEILISVFASILIEGGEDQFPPGVWQSIQEGGDQQDLVFLHDGVNSGIVISRAGQATDPLVISEVEIEMGVDQGESVTEGRRRLWTDQNIRGMEADLMFQSYLVTGSNGEPNTMYSMSSSVSPAKLEILSDAKTVFGSIAAEDGGWQGPSRYSIVGGWDELDGFLSRVTLKFSSNQTELADQSDESKGRDSMGIFGFFKSKNQSRQPLGMEQLQDRFQGGRHQKPLLKRSEWSL
jgi:hypothetical protein